MRSESCLPEQTILRFASGDLTNTELAVVEGHARECASCQCLLAAALAAESSSVEPNDLAASAGAEAPVGTLEPGTSVGRYTLLSFVGNGAMGEVYAAYDPKLDRRVALKLLRARGTGDDERAEARLLREAQSIACLSHPNVITVHDVGALGPRVFIAMEYVEGQTLSAWLAAEERSRTEILRVFMDAARGLAAAHTADLVHRDFKPQNVMVGVDGTVRVTDFGLARRFGANGGEPEAQGPEPASKRLIDASLTQTGELIGTPLYMAPEQFRRQTVDARTDQFSFCVALYQALYREHPFVADSGVGALMANVLGGKVRPASSRAGVPLWLRRVLLRGLAVDPAGRWSSMDTLRAALARDPNRLRRRWLMVGLGLLVTAGTSTAAVRGARRPVVVCQGGPSRLADAWQPAGMSGAGDARRKAIRTAFLATGVAYAPDTWTRVEALLDRYASRWLAAYEDTCRATHVRAEQSASVLDLRIACLDQRLAAFRSLTDLLIDADRQAVSAGVDAVNALPRLDRCADVPLLLAQVEPPHDTATGRRVDDLRRRAARAKALHDTGHNAQADAEGRQLIVEARQVGYAPLLAELLEMVGAFHVDATFTADSVSTLEEAVWTGIRSKRDDVAAEAAALLGGLIGYHLHREVDGERWATFADALLDRLGDGHEVVRAWILQSRATMIYEHDCAAALRLTRQALALKRRVLPPDHPDIGGSILTEAEDLACMGEYEEALERNARATDLMVQAYGAKGPYLSNLLSNRGEYLMALRRPAEALPLFREALSGWEAALGADHPYIAYPLTGLGRAQLALGRPAEAVALLQRAIRIREASEPDPAQRAETRFALAQALWATGARASGIAKAEKAREEYASTPPGPKAVAVGTWLADHDVAVRKLSYRRAVRRDAAR
jgi:tetratricopeptide (TPR) repeat protein